MSYIQVKLGGNDQGLKFNQLSIELFTENVNYEAVDTSSVYEIFFAGLMGNYYAKRKEVDFTFENVCDWVDELYQNEPAKVTEVCEVFASTNAYKQWIEQFKEKIRALTTPEEKPVVKKKAKVN